MTSQTWHGPRGNCGCCPLIGCLAGFSATISGLADKDCFPSSGTAEWSLLNGTYIMTPTHGTKGFPQTRTFDYVSLGVGDWEAAIRLTYQCNDPGPGFDYFLVLLMIRSDVWSTDDYTIRGEYSSFPDIIPEQFSAQITLSSDFGSAGIAPGSCQPDVFTATADIKSPP